MSNTSPVELKALTSLRFLFAFVVFLSHLSQIDAVKSENFNHIDANFLSEGFVGVNFFFVLSGFILCHVYLNDFCNSIVKIKFRNFLVKRFARIYPLYCLTLLLALPLYFPNFLEAPIRYLGILGVDLLLLKSLVPSSLVYFSFNSPSWSISTEFFFYLAFPFLIMFMFGRSLSQILLPFCIILVGYFLTITVLPDVFHHSQFYISPIFRLIDFSIGIFLYLIRRQLVQYALKPLCISIAQLLSVFILIVFIYFHALFDDVYRYSSYYWLPISLVVLSFSLNEGLLARLFGNKILVYLGEISFGFYLFHWLVIKYLNLLNVSTSLVVNALVAFVLTIILSMLSYEFFEKYCRKAITLKFLASNN